MAQTLHPFARCTLLLVTLAAASARAEDLGNAFVRLSTLKTHSRLVFRVDEQVATQLTESADGFRLELKGLHLSDLGAPLGEEAKWRAGLGKLEDQRLAKLEFSEVKGGVAVTGRWRFPEGKAALDHPEFEIFEYRDKKPGRAILDFWLKPGKTLAEAKRARKVASDHGEKEKLLAQAKLRDAQRARTSQAKETDDDVASFCREPMTEQNDVILPFRPHHERVRFEEWFSTTTPDVGFKYFEPTSKDREAQHVRLALKLYEEGKFGLAVRTLDFLDSEFPKSVYGPEMKFLRANALIKLNLNAEADQILLTLMNDAHQSPIAIQCGMFMASRLFTKGSFLSSLESFLWLARTYPEHRLAWVFHLGAAESLYALKQTDRAIVEYKWVMAHGPAKKARAEASLRLGDVYLDRFQYEQALTAYFEAANDFPEEARSFSGLMLNRGESLYGLGQFTQAKKVFQEVLKGSGGNPAIWRAAYRLGEISAREFPWSQKSQDESRKWYAETINRFPLSPGATLARMRLAACGDHGGFDIASAIQFFTGEAERFSGLGEVSVSRYSDLRAIALVRTLAGMNEFEEVVDTGIEQSQLSRDAKTRAVIGTLVQRAFRKKILADLADGKKYAALKFYHEKLPEIPKEAKPPNPDFLLALSQAAADLGLGKFASQLTLDHQNAEAKRRAWNRFGYRADGGAEEGEEFSDEERAPAAVAPSALPLIEDQMRASEEAHAEARALWMNAGLHLGKVANEELGAKLIGILGKIVDESPRAVEREVMLGILAEKSDRLKEARAHSIRAHLFGTTGEKDASIDSWAASLELREGDLSVATRLLADLEKRGEVKDNPKSIGRRYGLAPAFGLEEAMMKQAEVAEKRAQWREASQVYERMAEKKLGGNQARYGLGRALLNGGEKEKGLKVLEELTKSETKDFWRNLAAERLENEKVSAAKTD